MHNVQKYKGAMENFLQIVKSQLSFIFYGIFLLNLEGISDILNYLEIAQCIMALYDCHGLCFLFLEEL